MDKIDEFVNNLQEKIFDEAKEAYGEKGFQRWRNPCFTQKIKNPDAYGCITGECGDTMEIFLKFENNRVKQASYITDGCASSSICGSFAAELTIGKDPDELTEITGDTVLNKIGTLPETDMHCTTLAARTVQEALSNYMSKITASKSLKNNK